MHVVADALESKCFHDNWEKTSGLKPPHLRYKRSKGSLWLDGFNNPRCVKNELTRCKLKENECRRNEQQFRLARRQENWDIINLLKFCAKNGDVGKGSELHAYILEHKLFEKNCYIGSTLISMYARCCALAKAQQVFDELPISVRDVVAWNALIAGYVHQGHGEEALKIFDSMQYEGQDPNAVTFICALKACGSIGASTKGEQIHNQIVNLDILEKDTVLGGTLVDMYARCGALMKAQQVCNELPVRDAVAWTALIAGYVRQGQGNEAIRCFDSMQREGHSPDVVAFTCALRACASIGAISKGEQIHYKVIHMGMLEKDIMLGSMLVDMYARCGILAKAQLVFDKLTGRNVVAWSSLITAYAQEGQGDEALKCFDDMQHEGHSADAITFVCALKACGNIGSVARGKQIHDKIVSLGMLEKNVVLGSTLVDMYARCGALAKAQKVFTELPVRNVVAWTSLIAGYAEQGQGEEALKCFDGMQCEGHSPDVVTFICTLKACGSIGAAAKGEQIHHKIVSLGMLENDYVLASTLVDMYARCGALEKAQEVFNELNVRDVVAWTGLIAGYAQNGQGEEALKCFENMQQEGHSPDSITFFCALKACGIIGAAAKGKQIHDKIVSLGMVEKDTMLGNTLVDMYAKCGAVANAQQVFSELPLQNVVAWTAIIAGYAQQGQGEEALSSFNKMQSMGVRPDSATLVCLLNACSHSGLLDQAEISLLTSSLKFGILPDVELYCILVDLFGRAGKLDVALLAIAKMASAEYLLCWLALVGGCSKWRDVKIGRLAFEHALHLAKHDIGLYICMANIYVAAGMRGNAEKIEAMRVANESGK